MLKKVTKITKDSTILTYCHNKGDCKNCTVKNEIECIISLHNALTDFYDDLLEFHRSTTGHNRGYENTESVQLEDLIPTDS